VPTLKQEQGQEPQRALEPLRVQEPAVLSLLLLRQVQVEAGWPQRVPPSSQAQRIPPWALPGARWTLSVANSLQHQAFPPPTWEAQQL